LILNAFVAALDLPSNAMVNQRIPKTLLIKNSSPTPADKRRINEGIEEMKWLAALKPASSAVPEFRDSSREYLEIAILSAQLRPGAKTDRLSELIHRAIPYPVFLFLQSEDSLTVSLAHKRWSLAKAGATIIEGDVVAVQILPDPQNELYRSFLNAISFILQPRTNLFVLYQSWIDALIALQVAQLTGVYNKARDPAHAFARRDALQQSTKLEAEINRLRAIAKKERQLSRQVELNRIVKNLEEQLKQTRDIL